MSARIATLALALACMAAAHSAYSAPAAPPVGSLPSGDGATDATYTSYGIGPHMMDDAITTHLDLEKLEFAHDRDARNGLRWDGEFWAGTDRDKLWLKSEGEHEGGDTAGRAEAYWSHAVSPFWDLQLGARRDFGGGPARTWMGVGVEGTAPYGIETELTAYVGASGRTALALKAQYDLLLTQRLILTPELEANAYGRNDARRDIGSGLSDATLSLRLRYEITREVAPYIGVSFGRKFGDTARYAQADGDSRSDRALLAGVRIRF
ncbi:copper resistance protein [Bordetella genomosp. 9]|uniref:Copper resistance protein n=2 Tax=Bordetella genomosp. 9 TaxID=1416803 RepID=A0A261RLQ5_9BORD|nr:copper resistance protein [Bordetella genomosp. 9]